MTSCGSFSETTANAKSPPSYRTAVPFFKLSSPNALPTVERASGAPVWTRRRRSAMVGLSAANTERQTNINSPSRTSGSPFVEVKQKRCFAGIDDPVQHVCGAVHHGPGGNLLNLAIDGNL